MSLNDTMWTVSNRPIIGRASEHEENVSQEVEMPELCNTFCFKIWKSQQEMICQFVFSFLSLSFIWKTLTGMFLVF